MEIKRSITMLGATAVGFVGILTLHGGPGQSVGVSTVKPSTTTPTTAPTSAPGSAPAPTTTTTTTVPSTSGSALGQLENYSYGQMAVKVTIANNQIVGLSVENFKTLDSYSQQLAQQVVPMLKSEVLKAQGTKIYAVSGATYTSEAYAYSIQSALDKLHFK